MALLQIWIVLELCPGGELLQYLRKTGVTVSVSEKTRWSYEAASGIAYLHTKNCIHRDLAARNCLLTGGDPNRLKISDFGMSRIAEDDEDLYTGEHAHPAPPPPTSRMSECPILCQPSPPSKQGVCSQRIHLP